MCQAEAGSWQLHPGLLQSGILHIELLHPRVVLNKKVELEAEPKLESWHCDEGCGVCDRCLTL